jgi:hypothetical protein
MDKNELIALKDTANKVCFDLENTIKDLTKKNPLTLFTKEDSEKDEFQDKVYDDYPYGYTVSKHGYYLQGAVQKVEGNDVTLFLTGEDWGEEYEVGLSELPFGSQVEILAILIEKA